MSDRVCVMRAGRVEQVAAPRALYDRPVNRFVAGFLGEANLTSVREVGAGRLMTGWGVEVAAPAGEDPGGACLVRPERMAVAPPGLVPEGCNVVPGVVEEVVFMGDATRVALRTGTGETVLVREHNRAGMAELAAGAAAQAVWAVGDTRFVGDY